MRPLTLDDVLPLTDFVPRRREFLEAHERYLDRYRRIRIGPQATLQFENRQTLWFRMQEILRVSRLSEPERVRQQLSLYNRLLPGKSRLQAALLIQTDEETQAAEEPNFWKGLDGNQVSFWLGRDRLPSRLVTCRPEDRALGAAHWIELAVSVDQRKLLADARIAAYFAIACTDYQHESGPLSDEMRQSLLEDLELSDQD
jgi:Protein of unknown function (DUF3501)